MNDFARTFLFIFLVTALTVAGRSQEGKTASPATTPVPQQKADPPIRLPGDLVQFFSGEWSGVGEFASGKKIEADVSFTADLDNQWLIYRHADRPPNRYKALGVWGFEYSSKTFTMILNDNFGGSRLFSSDGWRDGKIIFFKQGAISPQKGVAPAQNQERFTFERQADQAFKMTYEVSKDGVTWRLGDYLIFKKHK
jgi:hypothetical protein